MLNQMEDMIGQFDRYQDDLFSKLTKKYGPEPVYKPALSIQVCRGRSFESITELHEKELQIRVREALKIKKFWDK